MADSVFVDSGYTIALLDSRDAHHGTAVRWYVQLAKARTPLVTSTAIITELVDGFCKPHEWRKLQPVLRGFESDPLVTTVDVDRALYDRAMALRTARADKDWGLTDCTSFLIMQDLGITRALSCDSHFQQAGFKALLIEP